MLVQKQSHEFGPANGREMAGNFNFSGPVGETWQLMDMSNSCAERLYSQWL